MVVVLVLVLFWVEGRGTGMTGVANMAELLVEEALDEDEDEAEPPVMLNRPE